MGIGEDWVLNGGSRLGNISIWSHHNMLPARGKPLRLIDFTPGADPRAILPTPRTSASADAVRAAFRAGIVYRGQQSLPAELYFSLVTLTTLGYGDVTPLTTLARISAALEAVVGQIYVVVLVARLVGINVSQTLALNAKKLKVGRTYTIRYRFWGEVAEARFVLVAGHDRR